MTKKRMIVELGMGTDLTGADYTKAAVRALRDALWHNSLTVANAVGQKPTDMIVKVLIGVPKPDQVNKDEVLAVLPYGSRSVEVVEGGLEVMNDEGTNTTLIANAAAIVYLDIPEK
ncbi:MAG: Lin0512 family protein [Alphaproteobacteria bacterium]|nr:Lin0512 family protein [Alphaproteobacteria bacterium]